MNHIAGALTSWGRPATPQQLTLLDGFAAWLREEAVAAGGLAPGEVERIEERHILDSLAFLQGLDSAPSRLLDLGSGVGLPGIPLAIMLPDTEVTLLDRSGRRVRLARRAIRVLGLDNVRVEQAEAAHRSCQVVTMRAVMDPGRAGALVDDQFPATRAILALRRGGAEPRIELRMRSHTVSVIDGGAGILDPAPWLLIMAPS